MRPKHLFIASLLCATCGLQAHATPPPAITPHDSLTFEWEGPSSSEVFDQLWATMDSVHLYHKGELTVLYIGGSHVQGGWIGHEMQRFLAAWTPHAEVSRGMHLRRLAHQHPNAFPDEMNDIGQRSDAHELRLIGMCCSTYCRDLGLSRGFNVHPTRQLPARFNAKRVYGR